MKNKRTLICLGCLFSIVGFSPLIFSSTSAAEHSPPTYDSQKSVPSKESLRSLAGDAFIYGLPIVLNYKTLYEYSVNSSSGQFKAPFNVLYNEHRLFTPEDTTVITPNSDTPYSFLSMDLRAEPIVLTVPEVPRSRYYSVQLVDANTFNFGYIGTRSTRGREGNYLVVAPGWKGEKPEGIDDVFYSSSDFAMALYRTQLLGPDDMPEVEKVQAGYKVHSLSAWQGKPSPAPAPELKWPEISNETLKTNFVDVLNFMLPHMPPGPEEKTIRALLAGIGIGTGNNALSVLLSPEQKEAVAEGVRDGEAKLRKFLKDGVVKVNGWDMISAFGDRQFYNGDWVLRATAAVVGLYGNDAKEAVYPLTRNLENGDRLDGSKHSYSLTFPKGNLPPVHSFWSITMYNGQTQLLVKNPIHRYLINSAMLHDMKTNPDGSLTVWIQKDSPGKANESNWLPAPDGPFYLAMRLYWPKDGKISVLPVGHGSWSPPALKVSHSHQ